MKNVVKFWKEFLLYFTTEFAKIRVAATGPKEV